MECPVCSYVFEPFEDECPRCRNLYKEAANSQQSETHDQHCEADTLMRPDQRELGERLALGLPVEQVPPPPDPLPIRSHTPVQSYEPLPVQTSRATLWGRAGFWLAFIISVVLLGGYLLTHHFFGRVAFVQNRNGTTEILLSNSDGSNMQQVTMNEMDDESPAFSPDGTQLAFTQRHEGIPELMVIDLRNANAIRQINTSDDCAAPTWASDGRRIAFTATRDDVSDIFEINLSNGMYRRITYKLNARNPQYSTDGDHIVFSTPTGIWMIHTKTKGLRQVTNKPDDAHPKFRSGMQQLTFIRSSSLYAQLPEQKFPSIYFQDNRGIEEYAWSPNGQELFYKTTTGSLIVTRLHRRVKIILGAGHAPSWGVQADITVKPASPSPKQSKKASTAGK